MSHVSYECIPQYWYCSWRSRTWKPVVIRMSHVTYKWVMVCMRTAVLTMFVMQSGWRPFVIRMSHDTNKWVMVCMRTAVLTLFVMRSGMVVSRYTDASCFIRMRHVSYEWVMSHMNESCLIWMSHVSYSWVMSHTDALCLICEHTAVLMVFVTRSGMEASRFLPRALSLMNPLCTPVHVCVGVKQKTKNTKKEGGKRWWKPVAFCQVPCPLRNRCFRKNSSFCVRKGMFWCRMVSDRDHSLLSNGDNSLMTPQRPFAFFLWQRPFAFCQMPYLLWFCCAQHFVGGCLPKKKRRMNSDWNQ